MFFPAQTVGKKVREMLNQVNSYRLRCSALYREKMEDLDHAYADTIELIDIKKS